ncbi:hypothetical protein Goari_012181, partial [Gossypium aridum]|nr:hypothetical protein [Gossypium aridum]
NNARFLRRSIHPAIKESQLELVAARKINRSRGQGTMLAVRTIAAATMNISTKQQAKNEKPRTK